MMRKRIGLWVGVCSLLSSLSAPAGLQAPTKLIGVLDSGQNWGTTRRCVVYYDPSISLKTPVFSVWTGYEDSMSGDFEDPGAITVNPHNGATYILAYDSGTPGTIAPATGGDQNGDYDLYRVNLDIVYSDWVGRGKPMDAMYAPVIGPDGQPAGDHPDRIGTTINLAGAVERIGEVARNQGSSFFDYDINYVNPGRMVVLDNEKADIESTATDHSYYAYNRTSKTGTGFPYNPTETWQSYELGQVHLDFDTSGQPVGWSEPINIAYVKKNGIEGVWVGETDGGGDDVAFFQIANWFGQAGNGYREQQVGTAPYRISFALDKDPTVDANTNDGHLDWIRVDKDGNPLIGLSGYYDTPPTEPRIIRREVKDYNAADSDGNGLNEIKFGAWNISGYLPVSGAIDDDPYVTDGRFVAYDKGTGRVYYMDLDSGGNIADCYPFDPVLGITGGTPAPGGTITGAQLDGINQFIERNGIRLFLRGDADDNGVIDSRDIDALFAAIKSDDPLLKEDLDLTGDGDCTASDVTELVVNILGTTTGDANLDGKVDVSDLGILAANYGGTDKTWAQGDFNGDGKVDVSDLGILAAHYGAGTGASADFKADAAALGLSVDGIQPTEKEATPVTSTLGCGAAGLPLIAGLFLAGMMLSGLKMKS